MQVTWRQGAYGLVITKLLLRGISRDLHRRSARSCSLFRPALRPSRPATGPGGLLRRAGAHSGPLRVHELDGGRRGPGRPAFTAPSPVVLRAVRHRAPLRRRRLDRRLGGGLPGRAEGGVHGFRNDSDAAATMLISFAPARPATSGASSPTSPSRAPGALRRGVGPTVAPTTSTAPPDQTYSPVDSLSATCIDRNPKWAYLTHPRAAM